jgi:putative heme-binding domain-containing protein
VRRNIVRYSLTQPDEKLAGELRWVGEFLFTVALGASPDNDLVLDILIGTRDSLQGKKKIPLAPVWPAALGIAALRGPAQARAAEEVGVLFNDGRTIQILKNRVADTRASVEDRRAAIELLAPLKLPGFAKTLQELLDDATVRGTALRALASDPDANTPAAILKVYPKLTAEEKADAVQTLASRVSFAKELLDALEKGTIPRSDVPVTAARQILALNDKALSARLDTVWGKIAPASKERAALIKKWKAALTDDALKKADVANGRAMFAKHCASCHKMFGDGEAFGPELTGSQRANLDYVLENVLDPSAVVPREFQLINFVTTDDRVVSGTILRETKDAVTVRTARETVVLPTTDIASRKQTNVSMMPEGLFDQMKPDEVRDLVAYLRAKEQVPIPKGK